MGSRLRGNDCVKLSPTLNPNGPHLVIAYMGNLSSSCPPLAL